MIYAIVWTVAYLIIAGGFFHSLCVEERKLTPRLRSPFRCILIAAFWPLSIGLGALCVLYEWIVDRKI